jgi:hypothetical protein
MLRQNVTDILASPGAGVSPEVDFASVAAFFCYGGAVFDAPAEAGMTIHRRAVLLSLALSMLPVAPTWSAPLSKALDPDKDGTMDLTEAKNAAAALFDRLDRDHDGTLDSRELRGRLDAKSFAAADTDKDGTIDKNEYLSVVEQRFKGADPDNDGTIDAKELASPAGKALKRLLQ